jgi:hypothetical protein
VRERVGVRDREKRGGENMFPKLRLEERRARNGN